MDIDDEAERLARAHPWAGMAQEREAVAWQPQHAVPRHRKPERLTPLEKFHIEDRVEADIARIDAELSPEGAEMRQLVGDSWMGIDFGQDAGDHTIKTTITDQHGMTYIGHVPLRIVAPPLAVGAYHQAAGRQARGNIGTMYADDHEQWHNNMQALSRRLTNALHAPKPGPGRPKQAKTYETPNRRAKRSVKANMSWIDRAKQSADARKR